MMQHKLKIQKMFWERISDGSKTCEIRKNDRDFQMGDLITFNILDEPPAFAFPKQKYKITHILYFPDGLKDGYVALSIKPFDE